jgi:DNA-binding SARP family transcriptional activator/predicted ATPase
MTEPQLHITLFGEFGMVVQGEPAHSFSGDRPISLLTYLLLHRHTAVSRQHLAFTLWPDSSDSQARANLRNLFYTLRQTLPHADNYLAADSMTLQWRTDVDFTLDVAEFEAALAGAKTAVSEADKLRWLETAAATYTGDLLPGNYEEWIIPRREALRQAYQEALHQLVDLLEQSGDVRAAARYAQSIIQHDPLNETAYVQSMRLQALSGNRAGVRRIYEQCVATLRRELDVEPGPATQAAYGQLLRQDASTVPAPRPESRPTAIQPSRLPAPATPFIGRETELAHLAELLADPNCRLVTIVGPGGMGKTRLALQTAVGHQPVFADGVVWVGLGVLQTSDQVATAIAEALHYRLSGAGNAEAELLPVLAAKELLLVLDNFEHLLPAADFLARLLAETTAVKLLVTSRQALEMAEEWRFDLGELPLPDEQLAETLTDNSAVQLFLQSARRAASAQPLSEADHPAIAHICRLVGGLPLGIELAASWVRLLTCAEIAQEIEKSLDFLTVSLRGLPPRHRSLRALFDYSWALLTPAEQQILRRLSLFRSGFTREAAAQVASADLPQLSALVDRSLVQRTAVNRYTLHNVIRQYAHDHLRADLAEYQETAAQHGRYTLQWLAAQDAVLRGPRQKDGLTAVARELANIRAAWEWAIDQQQADLLRLAAFPLFYFYELRGLLHEGEAAFRLAAESLQQDVAAAGRKTQVALCAMQTYQANLSFRTGKMALAETLLRQTMARLQILGDEALLGYSARHLGLIEWSMGRFAEALNLLQTSLTLAERQQDQWGMAMAQVYLGMIRQDQGQPNAARQQLTAVLPTVKTLGDPRLLGNALLVAGRTNLLLGHLAEAEQQLTACLEATRETNDPNSITYATHYLGLVKQAQGDMPAARQLIEQSVALFTEFNDLVGLERASVSFGFLEIDAGNLEAARSHFLTFLRARQRVHAVRYILAAVLGTAVVRAHFGDPFAALAWTLSVLQHPGLDWEASRRAETLRTELQAQLTPDQISQAQQVAGEQPFDAILSTIVGQ